MKRSSLILLICPVLVTACARQSPSPSASPSPSSAVAVPAESYDAKTPPTQKEILRSLLKNQDVPLGTDSSCSGVGTDPRDTDIGDYISGFLAEQTDEVGKNWLEVLAKSEAVPGGDPAWRCNVVIRHENGDDRWGWGTSFLMTAKDHSVLRKSFRCTGAG